jgi:hypothetical protein
MATSLQTTRRPKEIKGSFSWWASDERLKSGVHCLLNRGENSRCFREKLEALSINCIGFFLSGENNTYMTTNSGMKVIKYYINPKLISSDSTELAKTMQKLFLDSLSLSLSFTFQKLPETSAKIKEDMLKEDCWDTPILEKVFTFPIAGTRTGRINFHYPFLFRQCIDLIHKTPSLKKHLLDCLQRIGIRKVYIYEKLEEKYRIDPDSKILYISDSWFSDGRALENSDQSSVYVFLNILNEIVIQEKLQAASSHFETFEMRFILKRDLHNALNQARKENPLVFTARKQKLKDSIKDLYFILFEIEEAIESGTSVRRDIPQAIDLSDFGLFKPICLLLIDFRASRIASRKQEYLGEIARYILSSKSASTVNPLMIFLKKELPEQSYYLLKRGYLMELLKAKLGSYIDLLKRESNAEHGFYQLWELSKQFASFYSIEEFLKEALAAPNFAAYLEHCSQYRLAERLRRKKSSHSS